VAENADLGVQRLALLLTVALLSCTKPTSAPEPVRGSGEWYAFEGTWSAVGERHSLQLGPERRASVSNLSGSLLLKAERGLGVGFRAKAITFSDSLTGSVGRVVWTDERGDEIYSELRGDPIASGRRIDGTIVGGTGRYAGVTGKYEMEWQFVIETEEGVVQGRAVGLKGSVRFGEAHPSSPGGTMP
jgi:hypothetical protein